MPDEIGTHLFELMFVSVCVHLEAVSGVYLFDEGRHTEIPQLLELVLLRESNQLLSDVIDTHAVGVQVLDQSADGSSRGIKRDPESLGALKENRSSD